MFITAQWLRKYRFRLFWLDYKFLNSPNTPMCVAARLMRQSFLSKSYIPVLSFCLYIAPQPASWTYWLPNCMSTWLIQLLRTAIRHHLQRMQKVQLMITEVTNIMCACLKREYVLCFQMWQTEVSPQVMLCHR